MIIIHQERFNDINDSEGNSFECDLGVRNILLNFFLCYNKAVRFIFRNSTETHILFVIYTKNTLRASLKRGKSFPYINEFPTYDTKLSDGEIPVMLELW